MVTEQRWIFETRVQVEPVALKGAKIEYATGFNAKFIQIIK